MNKNIANRPAAEEFDSVVFWMSFLHFGVGTMGFFNHMGRGTHGFAHGRHVAMTRLKDMLSYVKVFESHPSPNSIPTPLMLTMMMVLILILRLATV